MLSPSGRYLALIERTGRGESVQVLDLQTRIRTTSLKPQNRDRAISWVRWKSDERLVAGLTQPGRDPGDGEGEVLTALDRDGGKAVALKAGRLKASGPIRMADPLRSDPGHVLVAALEPRGSRSLWKVDVHSGSAELVGEGEDDDLGGRLPRSAMVVRYDRRISASTEFDVLGPAEPGGRKAFVALQPREAADGDTATVRVYDFEKKTISEPVWPALKYDVSDIVYREADRSLAGVCYTADTFTCEFKDAELKADYDRAAGKLGGDKSLTPVSMSDSGRHWLFQVTGPTEPGAWYVMDRRTGRMTRAADRFPGLDEDDLGRGERYVYTARDGTRIPGYLTLPPGVKSAAEAKGLPLIVMPHGGPEARDALTFDIWAQVFATRGYMVLQPNFRGSSGYGRAWAEAGYRQWGGRMQDDITDGVRQLIKAGQADAGRVCIFGASFGGYAALYGGAQTPELYKCVASFAGVSDLKALVEWEKATPGHEPRYRYASRAIGDPRKDAARLKAASPVTHAAKYRLPVLLIHGGQDAAVPVRQSELMDRALRKAGRTVQLMTFPEEGHSDWSPENEQKALTALSEFFQAHIAPAELER